MEYRKRKAGPNNMDLGKEKMMFTVICSSHIYQENLQNASLYRKDEWGFGFVCSDENKLVRNTVVQDVSLSE